MRRLLGGMVGHRVTSLTAVTIGRRMADVKGRGVDVREQVGSHWLADG
jgi:hypothetical protein